MALLTIGLGISLEPIVGSLIGWALGVSGPPGLFTLAGGAMVLAATIVVTFAAGRRDTAEAAAAAATAATAVIGKNGSYADTVANGRDAAGHTTGRCGSDSGGSGDGDCKIHSSAGASGGWLRVGKACPSAEFSIENDEEQLGLGPRVGAESACWVQRDELIQVGSAVEMSRLLSLGNDSPREVLPK